MPQHDHVLPGIPAAVTRVDQKEAFRKGVVSPACDSTRLLTLPVGLGVFSLAALTADSNRLSVIIVVDVGVGVVDMAVVASILISLPNQTGIPSVRHRLLIPGIVCFRHSVVVVVVVVVVVYSSTL